MARIKPQALLQQSKKKKGPSRVSVPTIMVYVLVVVVMGFFLFATYRHWSRRSMNQLADSISIDEDDNAVINSKNFDNPRYAVIHTSKGSVTAELHKESSREVVNEFIDACKKGHFDGMQFNRVIKNFVIQGGNVDRPGAVEDWAKKGKHFGRLDTSLKHEAFMLGTSKTRSDGGGFDLIITTAPIPDLNQKIDLFGRVVKGEDVVQEIEEVDTDEHYRPKTRIEITEVILKENL
ncbi:OLC1v1030644C2 [Oldenlandia corymbosa var. corymbosa]|uniref:Peptidyl-prolyl cis-trans isomerase n=1 Tax=Oldenlandia corymbosa var. corymbosa TaxID=529605 RepID=A0AAV1CIF2_OLDCO|nr:OLC1v1030644C2 [Oldenlandia corymbosa var. corymbosa]